MPSRAGASGARTPRTGAQARVCTEPQRHLPAHPQGCAALRELDHFTRLYADSAGTGAGAGAGTGRAAGTRLGRFQHGAGDDIFADAIGQAQAQAAAAVSASHTIVAAGSGAADKVAHSASG